MHLVQNVRQLASIKSWEILEGRRQPSQGVFLGYGYFPAQKYHKKILPLIMLLLCIIAIIKSITFIRVWRVAHAKEGNLQINGGKQEYAVRRVYELVN